MLVTLLAADPRAETRRAVLRRLSLASGVLLAGAVLLSTGMLIDDLIRGGGVTQAATRCWRRERSSGSATA